VTPSETIYVYLDGEGTDVWAPMDAELVRENIYRIINDRGEKAQFKQGNLVKCQLKKLSDSECLVASEMAQ
jgi:hypothetical protein